MISFLTTADIVRRTGISAPTVRKYRREHDVPGGLLHKYSQVIYGKRMLREDCCALLMALRHQARKRRGQK